MDEDYIKDLCIRYSIDNYIIQEDELGLYIDVDGNVNMMNYNIKNIIPLRFGEVSGSFDCSWNSLKTLIGCPYKVGGDFFCNNNKLVSLLGAPSVVVGTFDCHSNRIENLKDIPNVINGAVSLYHNNINEEKDYYPLFEKGIPIDRIIDSNKMLATTYRIWQINQIIEH